MRFQQWIVFYLSWIYCAAQEAPGKCGPPPPINNGDITSFPLREYPSGAQVEYKCQNLYKLEGSKDVRCENGKWSNPPSCLEACTTSPEDMARNNIQLKWRNLEKIYVETGDMTEFTCRNGFRKAQGSPPFKVQCIQGKMTYPICVQWEAGECGPPPPIDNGDITSFPLQKYPSGAKVEYKCQNFYKLEGSKDVTCENGKWSNPPSCLDSCTASPEDMARNNVQLKWGNWEKIYSETGDTIEFACRRGFREAPGSPPFRAQCIQGKLTYPICVQYSCTASPEDMARNNIQLKWGNWEKIYYEPGDIIEFTCRSGFRKAEGSPPFRAQCVERKLTFPICVNWEAGECGPPPPIDNGDITSLPLQIYPSGAKVEYKCQNLYKLEGSKDVMCENGKWSNPPSCLGSCTASPEDMARNNIQLKWENWKKIFFEPGDIIEFTCRSGFRKAQGSPPFRARCIQGKLTYPICVQWEARECGPPPPIDNGDITSFPLQKYPSGAKVEYKCQNFYKLEGSKDVTCENGKWSNPPSCLDSCTASPEDMARNNIQLKWGSWEKIYSETGDIIEFACRSGFKKAEGSPPFRAQCIKGKLTYPICVHR